MVSISGSKKLKRQMAPVFWGINRKDKRFVVASRPGPHPRDRSIPISVFLRDMLGAVYTLREAKSTIYDGGVKVDGVIRKSIHYGIGLMDVIELKNVKGAYRMVPLRGKLLQPLIIHEDIGKKIAKVTSKSSIKGGHTALGFHDGRTIISDADIRVGDSCLLDVPNQNILEVIPMKSGSRVLVISGGNAGKSGKIEEIEEGTFTLPKRATISLGERTIEIPTGALMVIGTDKPVIKVDES